MKGFCHWSRFFFLFFLSFFLSPSSFISHHLCFSIYSCMLEFLKQQEKQRQEYLKQQEIQRQEDLKRLHENIKRHEERFAKLLECFSKQNDSGNLNIFSQESAIISVGEFIYKPEVTFFLSFSAFIHFSSSLFLSFFHPYSNLSISFPSPPPFYILLFISHPTLFTFFFFLLTHLFLLYFSLLSLGDCSHHSPHYRLPLQLPNVSFRHPQTLSLQFQSVFDHLNSRCMSET